MRLSIAVFCALAGLFAPASAGAQSSAIGVAAPLSGPSAILGAQISAGAHAAAAKLSVELEVADNSCTAEGGAKAARQFIAANVRIVVGFLCTESIEAALPILKDGGITAITVGVRTDSLTDHRAKSGWPVFRLAPRADAERDAASRILTDLWRDDFFAIVDDGTIYGREIAESFRAAAEQSGLKPVYVDTFRPESDNQISLVGRLRKAGATHVFVGGDRDDIAIMARDAAKLDAELVFAGGETLRAAPSDVPLAAGTLMIATPEWAEIADPAVVADLTARTVVPEGYVLPAYAAVQIAQAALADAGGTPLAAVLTGRDFATTLGPVRFDEKGDLSTNPYRAYRFNGTSFVPLETQ